MPVSSTEKTGQFVELAHGKVHYHQAGEGDDLLLLHGSGPGVTGWANYEGNLPIFADKFRCTILDFPGYGESSPIDGKPVSACVQVVVEALEKLDISKTHIIGNSLGGIVGAQIAARFPELVNRFVTIGGIGINLFSPFPGEGLNLLTAFVENPTRERVEQWLRSMVFDQSIVTEELIDARFKQAIEPITFESTRKLYSAEAIQRIKVFRHGAGAIDTVSHLPRIQCPTLITWGRDDRVSPLDIGLIPMRIIPNCELHIFPNCGHWAMIERKNEFESLVLSFLMRR